MATEEERANATATITKTLSGFEGDILAALGLGISELDVSGDDHSQ